jgi:hypothetical protein
VKNSIKGRPSHLAELAMWVGKLSSQLEAMAGNFGVYRTKFLVGTGAQGENLMSAAGLI